MNKLFCCVISIIFYMAACYWIKGEPDEQAVNFQKIQKDRYTQYIAHVVLPSEDEIRAKRIETELAKTDVVEFTSYLRKVISTNYFPSVAQLNKIIACSELRDGNDCVLLRYSPQDSINISIEEGKSLYVTITSDVDPISSLTEIGDYVKKTAIRFLNFSSTNNIEPKDVLVFVSSSDIGASKYGSLSYGPADTPPQHWFNDIRWWSDGHRVLFWISRKEWTKEEIARPRLLPDLSPRRFHFRKQQEALRSNPEVGNKDSKDASQQTTNQTAVGVQQIQGSGKTNDFGTAGNAVKP